MIRILAIGAFLMISQLAAAKKSTNHIYRLFPVLQCPAVGEEFERMISKLESIKSNIRMDANCENLDIKVKSLEDLVIKDRQAVTELIEKGETLTAEQTKLIRDYAENITKKVSSLNDLFIRSNHCFREDQADQQLATLSGFVSEASTMVGSLAGPWGAPIALAGNVIAGFLSGLDQVLKSRAGYDFSKRDQWMGYVQNLCTYHGFKDQIAHLLDPGQRISKLQALRRKIDTQLRPFDALDTSEIRLQHQGLLDWVNKELKRVEKESQGYWSDATGRHILYRAKDDIEDFLITREAPRFLSFQARQSRTDFNEFQTFANTEGRYLYEVLMRHYPDVLITKIESPRWTEPQDFFRALVLSPLHLERLPSDGPGEDVLFGIKHYREQSLLRLRTSQTSALVMQSFCSFFKHSGQYSSDIRSECSGVGFQNLVEAQNKLEAELAAAKLEDVLDRPSPLVVVDAHVGFYSLNKLDALIRFVDSQAINSEKH